MSNNADQDIVASLWPDMKTVLSEHYFCEQRPFTIPRAGNKVSVNRDGEQAFARIHDAIDAAETFVFIVDWQLSIDFELKRPKTGDVADVRHPYRLTELLSRKVAQGVDIRILIYDAPWAVESEVPTYDSDVAKIINDLGRKLKNAGAPGSLICIEHGPTTPRLNSIFFSHHQKMVLVDGRHGFVGGMDMTNGRWDTIEFDCVINPERFVMNDMYNPCLDRGRSPTHQELQWTLPDFAGVVEALKVNGQDVYKPGFASPQYKSNARHGRLLEAGCQPRMPWQDVHIMIEGPALKDLYRNVVRRLDGYVAQSDVWGGYLNAADKSQEQQKFRKKLQRIQTPQALLDKWRDAVAKNATPKGKAYVQIVRSVSARHLQGEAYRLDDLKLETQPGRAAAWERAVMAWKGQSQDNIYQAMLACINAAKAYIYIETQFFISAHGGMSKAMIDNRIVNALASKVIDMHHSGIGFHIYIVLPVHPEGAPTNEATYKQQHLALQSLAHGSGSLFAKIREGTKQDPANYVTVLNLRTHGVVVQYARDRRTGANLLDQEIGRYVVTEQIYVHSKLMIVDDAVAIVGSANTNDRSLTGEGDSELAAVVVDDEDVRDENLGNGNKVLTRKFARELRTAIWRKHLGLDLPSADTAGRVFYAADSLAVGAEKLNGRPRVPHPPRIQPQSKIGVFEAWIKQPALPKTWEGIKILSEANTQVYEEIFAHIPSNRLRKFDAGLAYYPGPQSEQARERDRIRVEQTSLNEARLSQLALEDDVRRQVRADMAHDLDTELDLDDEKHMVMGRAKPSHADLSSAPPILTQRYMRPMLDFQKQQPNYTTYQVTFHGEASQKLVHDCDAAINRLRAGIAGFWVAAPLMWGQDETVLNPYMTKAGVSLASNDAVSPEPPSQVELVPGHSVVGA